MRTPKRPRTDVPRDPRERSIWVQSELRKAGSSFAAIAREIGVDRRAPSQAMFLPNMRVEQALADAVGLTVEALFPERFDETGRRLHAVRGAQDNTGILAANVQAEKAA